MSEEKKSVTRVRINLFDVVLVLLAILCIVGIWQRKNLQNLFTSDDTLEAYQVKFEIEQERTALVDNYLLAGTEIYIEQNGERILLGTLTERATSGAVSVYLPDANGEIVDAIYHVDDLSSAVGTLKSNGLEHGGAFLLEGEIYLSVNQTLTAHTELADFEIRIVSIQKVA